MRLSSFPFILSSFFHSASFISTILSSCSLILSSVSVTLLLFLSTVFLISVIALFITNWLFFISSVSLANIMCIFSVYVSNLFICIFILLSRFWTIFTIIILNYFPGRLPITSSFVLFGGFLSCSFTCWIFLSLFILFSFLCLGSPFCRLEGDSSPSLWSLFPVCGVGPVACECFLVGGTCVCVLVNGTGSHLSAGQCSVQ